MQQENYVRLSGIVERVTFHNSENGWSILKVAPFNNQHKLVAVIIHQAKVFAGSSMEFTGHWANHPKYGEQFKATSAIEKKPASSAALEKYLGSGLIKGVGPKTAKKIVRFFKEKTLDVFEENIQELVKVPGIAKIKLIQIKGAWQEHRSIRNVMLFLQEYGVSTLFAVKIYKTYGNKAIRTVSGNPYQLAKDIYGIGFFSADRIALSMGFEKNGVLRIEAGIKHVLTASRDEGHCFLTQQQIEENTSSLLHLDCAEQVGVILKFLQKNDEIKSRSIALEKNITEKVYYSKSLYYDEKYVSEKVRHLLCQKILSNSQRVEDWIGKFCSKSELQLSKEQRDSIVNIVVKPFSILTGGPGCGKTTTTRVLVKLLLAMKKKVILAAPTGRAAQRMSDVIGFEAKTIHRLLEVDPLKGGFKKNEEEQLKCDFIIIDECSMLDISLAASLLKAVPLASQVLFIGDPDQLPSVGAGNVLQDLLLSQAVPSVWLREVFRQAKESKIISFAHEINKGQVPKIDSPIRNAKLWHQKTTCLFIDAEEATKDQISFIRRAKAVVESVIDSGGEQLVKKGENFAGVLKCEERNLKIEELMVQDYENLDNINKPIFVIPDKFKHVDLNKFHKSEGDIEKLKSIIKNIHPWSSLHYGKTGLEVVVRLFSETVNKYFGQQEIQILSPQIRGSLGTLNLNTQIQEKINPQRTGIKEIKLGEKVYREGDRVIQTKNNYDKHVYNGDIGKILKIDLDSFQSLISFANKEPVVYEKDDLTEISLAYAITIHKSQGSEFDTVILPVTTQHYNMLFRNLIYTGLTRAKKLCIFVGSRKALSLAIKKIDNRKRQTALTSLIESA